MQRVETEVNGGRPAGSQGSSVSKLSETKMKTFRDKILPEWASIAKKYKFDVNSLTADEKKIVLTAFREFWEQNPPF